MIRPALMTGRVTGIEPYINSEGSQVGCYMTIMSKQKDGINEQKKPVWKQIHTTFYVNSRTMEYYKIAVKTKVTVHYFIHSEPSISYGKRYYNHKITVTKMFSHD